MATIKLNSCEVAYDDSPKAQADVFNAVIAFFLSQETFTGESLMQSDAFYEDMPDLMANLADDVIKFKVKWSDDDV